MSTTSASVAVGHPNLRPQPPSVSTAEGLAFAARILQIFGAVFVTFVLVILISASVFRPFPFIWIVGLAAGILGAVAILFLCIAYEYSYRRIRRGDYVGAQGPILVVGILSVFFGIIPGILYLIGYFKLGDAIREQQFGAAPYTAPFSPYGPSIAPQQACRGCGRVFFVGQFLYCPNCGQKIGGKAPLQILEDPFDLACCGVQLL